MFWSGLRHSHPALSVILHLECRDNVVRLWNFVHVSRVVARNVRGLTEASWVLVEARMMHLESPMARFSRKRVMISRLGYQPNGLDVIQHSPENFDSAPGVPACGLDGYLLVTPVTPFTCQLRQLPAG